MNPIEQLQSVLCDPEGKCCITGSDEDRAIIDRALKALAQPDPLAGGSKGMHGQVTEILDRLDVFVGDLGKAIYRELRTALAQSVQSVQPEQEPKACKHAQQCLSGLECLCQTKPHPLTITKIWSIASEVEIQGAIVEFVRAIEAAHGIGTTL